MNQIVVSDLGMHGKKAENGFKSVSRCANCKNSTMKL